MKTEWKIVVSGQAKKFNQILPEKTKKSFLTLLLQLQTGPEVPLWTHYGKLGSMTYHCHLKGSHRPTYVACWTADKKNKIIEVYYAGTHEKAPY